MNFFKHQEEAKKRTTLLVVLFVLAALALVVILNLLIAALFIGGGVGGTRDLLDYVPLEQWLLISLVVLVGIGGASLLRWLQLRGGGKVVAQSLGGHLVPLDTDDFYQQRLLNIVEEIALAAGVPVPPVYLLPESEINAFAAGYNLSDAVIAVTEGCLIKLNREQLQGVIAHEYSHIFNGDMRLNIRMMALLYGITFISLVGRFLLQIGGSSGSRRSRDNNRAAILGLGLGLMLIGSLGVLFGSLIKAAVSRQREYLADAQAVQYTRNPNGIAEALKIIGHEGSRVYNPHSREAAHLFFGDALGRYQFSLLATHPALTDRIRRLEPNWDGEFISTEDVQQAYFAEQRQQQEQASHQAAQSNAILNQLRQRAGAVGLVFAVLGHYVGKPLQFPVKAISTDLDAIAEEDFLALVERSIPALKQLSKTDYEKLRDTLEQAQAGAQNKLMAWCLFSLVSHYLDGHFYPVRSLNSKRLRLAQTQAAIAVVLSALAQYGHTDEQEAARAFQAGCEAAGFADLQLQPVTDMSTLDEALELLKQAQAPILGRLAKAMRVTVEHDGQVQPVELNLTRTIGAILEFPDLTAVGL